MSYYARESKLKVSFVYSFETNAQTAWQAGFSWWKFGYQGNVLGYPNRRLKVVGPISESPVVCKRKLDRCMKVFGSKDSSLAIFAAGTCWSYKGTFTFGGKELDEAPSRVWKLF